MTEFKELQKRAEKINQANGWNRGATLAALVRQGTFSEEIVTEHQIAVLALIMTEVAEAIEEVRNGKPVAETYYPTKPGPGMVTDTGYHVYKPEGVPSELADVVIRALSFAEVWGIDLEAAILEKMAYNETRAYRHGGKKL